MKRHLSSLFRLFTIALLLVSIVTAYMNVFSDDTQVRARASELARKAAGCGDACKVTNMRGDRGMLTERIDYDIQGARAGHYAVACRRTYYAVGNYVCEIVE